MGIGKGRAALGEAINMGSLDHGMAAQIANPVILIVNGDHQDIGFLIRRREGEGQNESCQ
jgi:hypothetical protein